MNTEIQKPLLANAQPEVQEKEPEKQTGQVTRNALEVTLLLIGYQCVYRAVPIQENQTTAR
jgi:hypothetical protein